MSLLEGLSRDGYRNFSRLALVAIVGLIGAIAVIGGLFQTPIDALVVMAAVAVVFSLSITVWWWPRTGPGWLLPAVTLVATAGLFLALLHDAHWSVDAALLLPFSYAIGTRRPWWPWALSALLVLFALAVLPEVIPGAGSGLRSRTTVEVFLIVGQIVCFLAVQVGWRLFERWNTSQERERELAIAQERLRFANDLHDVQGHTLVAIKLKAELALKNLDRNLDRSRIELRDIEELVADASTQARDIARGYRPRTLAAELSNLRDLLTAAGIQVTMNPPDLGKIFFGDWEELFATAVREAGSNILRHAYPTLARFEVSEDRISVTNDGVSAFRRLGDGGTGLSSLRDRFAKRGGTIRWFKSDDETAFTVEISRHAEPCREESLP
jgi:two-component system sensor histidine kinase DesK